MHRVRAGCAMAKIGKVHVLKKMQKCDIVVKKGVTVVILVNKNITINGIYEGKGFVRMQLETTDIYRVAESEWPIRVFQDLLRFKFSKLGTKVSGCALVKYNNFVSEVLRHHINFVILNDIPWICSNFPILRFILRW